MTLAYRLVRHPPEQITLSGDQERVASHGKGVLSVVGAPRTGKTTALVHASIRAVRTNACPHVLYFTRARQQRFDVVTKIAHTDPEVLDQIDVVTFYGLAWSLACHTSEEPLRLLTAARQDAYVRDLLAGAGPTVWPDSLAEASSTSRFAGEVREKIAAAARLGWSGDDLRQRAEAEGRDDWMAFSRFMRTYQDTLALEGTYDYSDLLAAAASNLARPDVAQSVCGTGALIVVDDAEDMDEAQMRILEVLVDHSTPVIIAQDPDCTVNSFRGAQPRSIADMATAWSQRGIGSSTICLTEAHNVSSAMAGACGSLRQQIPLPPGSASFVADYRLTAGDRKGSVDKVVFFDVNEEAHGIAQIIRHAHLVDGLAWDRMAVLIRGKGQLPAYELAMHQEGIPVSLMGDEVTLSSEPIVRSLIDVLRWVGGDDSHELSRVYSPSGGSESIDEMVAAGKEHESDGVYEILWAIWQASGWQRVLAEQAGSSEPEGRRANKDLDAVIALFTLASRYNGDSGEQSVRLFIEAIESQEIPDDVPTTSMWSSRGVRLTTAHRAKGRSWPLVVVAGMQSGLWPHGSHRPPVIDMDGLAPGLEEQTPSQSRAAERRLAWVACSTAEDALIVTAVDSDDQRPSVFFEQIDAPTRRGVQGESRILSISSLLGDLRRVAEDDQDNPGLRQAAVDRLAALIPPRDSEATREVSPGAVQSHVTHRDASPERWWPVAKYAAQDSPETTHDADPAKRQNVRLSGSQVEALLSCPRQWFLSTQSQGSHMGGSARGVGSLVHDLAQDPLATYQDMVEELEARWDEIQFDASWIADARLDQARAMLARLEAWRIARGRHVLGCEVSLHHDVDVHGETVTIVGRIDRLELDDTGRVWVVDFKTGKYAPTRKEAEENLQMGIYQIGVSGSGVAQLTGADPVVGGAELVYLGIDARKGSLMPKTFVQSPIAEKPYLEAEPSPSVLTSPEIDRVGTQRAYPTWVHQRLAVARSIVESRTYPALEGKSCRYCEFVSTCPIKGAS